MEQILQNPFKEVLAGIRGMDPGYIHMDMKTLGLDLALELHKVISQSLSDFEYKSIVYSNTPKDIPVSEYILISKANILLETINVEKKYKSKGIRALVCSRTEQKKLTHHHMFNSFIRFDDIISISTEGVEKNFIRIIATNGSFIKRKSLFQIKLSLPPSFIQVEKRDIINLNFLQGMNENYSIVFMENTRGINEFKAVQVGRNFREQLKKELDNELYV